MTQGIQRVIIAFIGNKSFIIDTNEEERIWLTIKKYSTLFQSVTKTITLLQQVQQETEEIHRSADEPTLTILRRSENKNNDGDENVSST